MKTIFTTTLIALCLFISDSKTRSLDIQNNNCYWEESNGNNISGKRGVSCGSDNSIKLYFTNSYSYKVRVAFYLQNADGTLNRNGEPYIITVNPGKKVSHHNCYSNGRFTVLVAKSGTYCKFPRL